MSLLRTLSSILFIISISLMTSLEMDTALVGAEMELELELELEVWLEEESVADKARNFLKNFEFLLDAAVDVDESVSLLDNVVFGEY